MITGTNFSKKIRGATRIRATALTLLAYSYMRRVDNGSALRRSLLPTGVRFALESPFTVLPCRNHTACGSLQEKSCKLLPFLIGLCYYYTLIFGFVNDFL